MSKIYVVKSGDTLSKIASKLGIKLSELLDSNPNFKANPNLIKIGNKIIIPEKETTTIIEIKEPLATVEVIPTENTEEAKKTKYELGSLSAKYEVGNRGAGTVSTGIGDAGGASYGSYQMTSKPSGGTVGRFVKQSDFPFKGNFQGLTPGTAQFTKVWKELALDYPGLFKNVQHEYIKKTHYDPLVANIKAQKGIDITKHSEALQNVVWSTAVQHGPASTIVQKAIVNLGGLSESSSTFDLSLIKAIYAERGRKEADGGLVYFGRNSAKVQQGVANRFVSELKDALKMLA